MKRLIALALGTGITLHAAAALADHAGWGFAADRWAKKTNVGKRFVIDCGPHPDGKTTASVYGGAGGVYSGYSYICAAAVHAGKIKVTRGGSFTILVTTERRSYAGTHRNGIAAKSDTRNKASFSFR